MTSPFLTAWPSLNGSAMSSPETSGAIPTSTSGWTLPVAVTRCVMFRTTAFSVVTMVGFTAFRLLSTAATTRPSTTTMPRMIHRPRRDFLRAGIAAGAGAIGGRKDGSEVMG